MSSEVIAALIGVGVGGIVGGLINWLIARSNFNREKRAELNIRRKSNLYSPLRRSLMQFKFQLDKKTYPEGFRIDPDNRELRIYHYVRGPDFTIWQEMKNDAREYHVPDNIKLQLDEFRSLLAEYNDLFNRFDLIVGRVWAPIGQEVSGNKDGWTEGPYPDVTLGLLENSINMITELYLYAQKDIDKSKWENAACLLIEKIGNHPDAVRIRELRTTIHNKTEALIGLFSEEIEKVVNMYEARESIWRQYKYGKLWIKRKRNKRNNPGTC